MSGVFRSGNLDRVVCDAYSARRLVLSLLAGPIEQNRVRAVAARTPAFASDGWELCLRIERCAEPLEDVFRRTACEDVLPESLRSILGREAAWERQRISSARRQLELIGAWGAEHGARPVALKGGLSALGIGGVDLNDVDVLLPLEDARRLLSWLVERGYRRSGWDTPDHLRGVTEQGQLQVEIHYGLEGTAVASGSRLWRRIEAIPTAPGLWRLAPADHLWHVLAHQVVEHPSRRGRVRDVLVLRSALADCSPADVDAARSRVQRNPHSNALELALEHAIRWSQGFGRDDPFPEIVLAGYLLGRRRENRSKVYPTSGKVNEWVYAQLTGRPERRLHWSRIRRRSEDLSGYATIRRVQSASPRLGRLLQVSGRLVLYAARWIRAYPLAVSIRRRVRRHLQVVGSGSETA